MNFCPRCGAKLVLKKLDEAERDVCPTPQCNYIHWNNPIPVVAALVKHKDHYIIARNSQWPRRIFSIITGYLEQNESPQEAVLREVSEELGLTGKIKTLIGAYSFVEQNQIIICYEVEATGQLTTNHEIADVKHLTPEELSDYDFSPLYITRNIIHDWKKIQSSI